LRGRGGARGPGRARAARLRLRPEVLAHVQLVGCAWGHQRHRADEVHRAGAAPGPGVRLGLRRPKGAAGLSAAAPGGGVVVKLDLLVEIGTEELPARFVDGALGQMQEAAEKQLADLRLTYDRLEVKGTPRRLALLVFGLAARQEDLVREMKGPSDRKSTRLNSSHVKSSYAVFCFKK